ncbi:MAG: hypothetical protein J0M12_07785 [Deltaproteobacteria bacterium]|nr:hypothetical protein [Deltaproteobacteria bacterium]
MVCRGGNIPAYMSMMRQAVKEKLDSQSVPYKRVAVSFVKIKRPKGTLTANFVDGLAVGDGATPVVTYTGDFPTPEACTMTAQVRILVVYENAKTVTNTEVSIPGTMLWRKPARFLSPNDLD